MKLALPPAHRLARINYPPRTFAFAFTFLVFAVLWAERGFEVWELFFAALSFLVYPHLAYFHACIAPDSKRAELNNLYADSILVGIWAAQVHFALWPTAAVLAAVSLNSAANGGLKRLFRGVACFAAAAAAWGAAMGVAFKPDTGPVVTGLSVFGILSYLSWIGVIVFAQNKNLLRARNAQRSSEAQFRFIAENVGDLVSVVDTGGRFLYASASHEKHFDPDSVGSGADWLLLVHPDDREQAKSFLNTIAVSGTGKRTQLRMVSAKGSWRLVECQGNPVRDNTSKPKMIVLVTRDLTAFVDPESDDRISEKLLAAADRKYVLEEKRVVTELLDRLLGLDRKAGMGPPKLQSIEDVHRYVEALSARRAEDDRRVEIWRILERATLMLALAGSFLNYYLLTVLDTINSLPQGNFMVVRATVKTSQIIVFFTLA